ncbi:hypothetical protein SGRA_3914 [Saprospira grandis str. Lewin]|uniref:Uncharacterized protein n=1 Tax=Saprospira grandis (strain Lewin) TaxID=984262 RepID=H6L738_SAPGL|nr:hypothetical protein SGRA_3914 [Saprospira grandis str. Lewin]
MRGYANGRAKALVCYKNGKGSLLKNNNRPTTTAKKNPLEGGDDDFLVSLGPWP